jgi:hypothetical protein
MEHEEILREFLEQIPPDERRIFLASNQPERRQCKCGKMMELNSEGRCIFCELDRPG